MVFRKLFSISVWAYVVFSWNNTVVQCDHTVIVGCCLRSGFVAHKVVLCAYTVCICCSIKGETLINMGLRKLFSVNVWTYVVVAWNHTVVQCDHTVVVGVVVYVCMYIWLPRGAYIWLARIPGILHFLGVHVNIWLPRSACIRLPRIPGNPHFPCMHMGATVQEHRCQFSATNTRTQMPICATIHEHRWQLSRYGSYLWS